MSIPLTLVLTGTPVRCFLEHPPAGFFRGRVRVGVSVRARVRVRGSGRVIIIIRVTVRP